MTDGELPACPVDDVTGGSEESDDDDVEASLKKELESMKAVPAEQRRFQKCNTKAKNLIFIRSTVADPVRVCRLMMEDIAEHRLQRARHAARILPVLATCKAHTPDITKMAAQCLPQFFSPGSEGVPTSYTVMFRARHNNTTTCGKTSVVRELTCVVRDINPHVTFSWTTFDLAVLVEVVCTVACLVVAPGFTRLRKYNLQELQQGPRTDTAHNTNVSSSGHVNDDTDCADSKQADFAGQNHASAGTDTASESVVNDTGDVSLDDTAERTVDITDSTDNKTESTDNKTDSTDNQNVNAPLSCSPNLCEDTNSDTAMVHPENTVLDSDGIPCDQDQQEKTHDVKEVEPTALNEKDTAIQSSND